MTVSAGFDAIGDKCLGHAQPGTVALQAACRAAFNTTSDGIYNCRNVRGGTTKSAHAEGRAVDVHWTDEASGRTIADYLVAHNAELGIQCVIWWDRIWSYSVGHWHDYHGQDPHHAHLHVEQNWSGAHDLTREAADAVLGSFNHGDDDMPLDQQDKQFLTELLANQLGTIRDQIVAEVRAHSGGSGGATAAEIAEAVLDEQAKRLSE